MRARWPGRAAAAVVAAVVLGLLAYAFRPRPVEVDVGDVTRGAVAVTVDEEGRTRVRERFVVASPLAGRLRRIDLHPGDPVRRGVTVLAVVEPPLPEMLDVRQRRRSEALVGAATEAVAKAQATVDRTRLEQEHAERERDRVTRMAAGGAASASELDAAEQAERVAAEDLRAAQHALRVAEFELVLAQAALDIATTPDGGPAPTTTRPLEIRSPVDGAVLRVPQESETVVAEGTPLIEVGDVGDIEVVVEVLSRDAVRIAPGARAILAEWGGPRPLAGRVRRVEPGAFTKVSALGVEEQRVLAIVDFTDPPAERARLGDGYRVEARIVVDEVRDALVVPAGALFRDGGGWAAFRVSLGVAELRKVAAGRTDGRVTEVLSGLDAGDRVVLHPGADVTPGAAVVARSQGGR